MEQRFDFPDNTPREVQLLAHALARVHGPIRVRRERSGLQIYLACPDCLQARGKAEFRDMHLAINAERACGLGKWGARSGAYDADLSGLCMKEQKPWRVTTLKTMLPVSERGYPETVARVTLPSVRRCVTTDANGNVIPEHPGMVQPVIDLPSDHPAVWYLTNRGYNLQSLWEQFRCSFCCQETPADKDRGLFYRRLPQGFRETPQGRIIFYGDVHGVQRTWQGRVIERVYNGYKYYLHPYNFTWVPMEQKDPATGKWVAIPGVEEGELLWKIARYKTATDSQRVLLGFDAAIRWNEARQRTKRLILLTEGPLDAGRFGPPGCPMIGKYFSEEQQAMVLNYFDIVGYVGQNDQAGYDAAERARATLEGRKKFFAVFPPAGVKDVGEMTTLDALRLIFEGLAKIGETL